jgi:hypothetical protein
VVICPSLHLWTLSHNMFRTERFTVRSISNLSICSQKSEQEKSLTVKKMLIAVDRSKRVSSVPLARES